MQLTNLKYINYLSNYDLLYKHNIKNVKNIIKVKSLVVDFPLNKDLLNNYANSKDSTQNINSKLFFLFYLFFSLKSQVNYKILKKDESNYSLTINIKNKDHLNTIIHKLYFYFISNQSFQNSTNFYKIKTLFPNIKNINIKKFNFINKIEKSKNLKIKKINFKLEVPIICIHLLNFYPNFLFEKFDSKNTIININFQINTLKTKFFGINSILNLPFLWILK